VSKKEEIEMGKIKCADGGSATVGETFEFENHGDEACTIGDYSAFLSSIATNPVPAASNGTAGTSSATVKSNIATGDYQYTASCRKKRGNPVIHVNSSKP
jgi:hypothetical protein